MPHRDPERQRAAERRWYHANKATVIAKKDRKRERLRQMMRDAKEVPCADCGASYPFFVMDFDHVDGEKVMIVSQLINRGSVSKLLAEMDKCEIVCANCHRIRTWTRLQGAATTNTPPSEPEADSQLALFD